MKKLTVFVALLLLTAILCGCAAATTGNTVPTDVPTTPTATQPTEPKTTEPQEPGELSYTSYVAAWAEWKDFPINRLYIIRSFTQLRSVFGKLLTEEQLNKYPDSYFASNTLLCYVFRDSGNKSWYRMSDLFETEDGGYSVELEGYCEKTSEYGNEKIAFVLITEVNRVIEWDTKFVTDFYQFTCTEGWDKGFSGEYYQENFITANDTNQTYVSPSFRKSDHVEVSLEASKQKEYYILLDAYVWPDPLPVKS
jgi:hypothetical protein